MKTGPIDSLVDERAARVLAALVLATIAVAGFTDAGWAIAWVAAGFIVRAVWGPRFSVYARLASAVATRLWTVRLVAEAPKRFAQGIGAACLSLSSVLLLTGHSGLAWLVAGVVAVFAGLEAAVGLCVGCWIYGHLAARGLVQPEVCVDCAPRLGRPTRAEPE
jgi:hypothetical protein